MTRQKHLALLAEDNPDHALITTEAIEDGASDVDVQVVTDGQQVLDFLASLVDAGTPLPALILLDIKMPRINGLDVLERIKSDDRLRAIPVVMLSSSDDDRDIARSYALGSNSFVTKPVGSGELQARLSQIPSYWFDVNTPPHEVTEK